MRRILFLGFIFISLVKSLIINSCINNNEIALTFDDGPSIKTTKKLLDVLDTLEVKSTFHVVTKHFGYPEVQNLMKDIILRGHVLGYRLEAEWAMQNVSTSGIQGAVENRLEMIKLATGKKPKFIRTSYNATEIIKNALIASGLIVTIPNFESYDYKNTFSIQEMIARFDELDYRSFITVQREFAQDLIQSTVDFVSHLRSRGFKIVTLQQCTGIDEIYSDEKSIAPLNLPVSPLETTHLMNESNVESDAEKISWSNSIIVWIISGILLLITSL